MDRDQEIRLVTDCQLGDRRALDTLVRQYQRPVYNAAYRMLGNADEAADVTQATFLKALENIGSFDKKYRFFSWIYRIALNESIDRLKTNRRFETFDDTRAADGERPQDDLSRVQSAELIQRALMQLNEDLRSVLVLRYFSELSYAQIGEVLDLPGKTVKSRLFTARQQLKARLERHGVSGS